MDPCHKHQQPKEQVQLLGLIDTCLLTATKVPIAFQTMANMHFFEICSPRIEEAKEMDSNDLPLHLQQCPDINLLLGSSPTSVVDDRLHSTPWINSKHGLFPRATSNPPPPPSTKRARCRSVSFATDVEVFEVSGHCEDDRQATWLGKEDFRRIRAECRLTVQKLSSGKLKEGNEEFTMRGLENKTRVRAARLKQMDRESHHAVFEEQELQVSEDNSDPEAIALFYADFTNNARAIALIQGHNDAQEAKKAHQC
jgi:hypothetical protein